MSILDFRKGKSERLADKGYDCIRENDFQEALEIAAELEKLRYSAAFEIAALAHAGLDDLEEAVRVLERGVEKAPAVWLNWQLLGNYRSDLDLYEEAAASYERALQCPDVDTDSVRFNQAILASRRELHDDALAFLDQLIDPEWEVRRAMAQVTALAGLGRFEDAFACGEAVLAEADDETSEDHGYLAGSLARARVARGDTAAEVFEFACAALENYDRSNRELLAAIRDADNAYSKEAKYYRMTVDAKIPFTDPAYQEAKGYLVVYDIVADSIGEAVAYIERMEDPVVRGNLVVDEHEIVEDRTEDPKGVYRRSGRMYYETED